MIVNLPKRGASLGVSPGFGKDGVLKKPVDQNLDGSSGEVVQPVSRRVRLGIGMAVKQSFQTRLCESFLSVQQAHKITIAEVGPEYLPGFSCQGCIVGATVCPHMILGQLIKSWRKDKDLSLRAASRLIGLDLNALHRLESGRPCDGVNLAKVLKWSFTNGKTAK